MANDWLRRTCSDDETFSHLLSAFAGKPLPLRPHRRSKPRPRAALTPARPSELRPSSLRSIGLIRGDIQGTLIHVNSRHSCGEWARRRHRPSLRYCRPELRSKGSRERERHRGQPDRGECRAELARRTGRKFERQALSAPFLVGAIKDAGAARVRARAPYRATRARIAAPAPMTFKIGRSRADLRSFRWMFADGSNFSNNQV